MSDEPAPGVPATWPAGARLDDADCVAAACGACGLAWRVHRSMEGFRLRCRCGEFVAVPVATAAVARLDGGAAPLAQLPPDDDAMPLTSAPRPRELAGVRGWDGRPLRPDADGAWTLRHAEVDVRRKWTNKSVIAFVLLFAAFVVPPLLVGVFAPASREAVLIPLASLASSLLVVVIAHASRDFAWKGLNGAALRHFAEAVVVALALAGLAVVYVHSIRSHFPRAGGAERAICDELGLPAALFVISFCPGIFEELAFRGVLQERFGLLVGRGQAALITGAVFGAAHGLGAGLPFQMGFGIWAAWLRDRSGSLLPGMLAHMIYNATLVVALAA